MKKLQPRKKPPARRMQLIRRYRLPGDTNAQDIPPKIECITLQHVTPADQDGRGRQHIKRRRVPIQEGEVGQAVGGPEADAAEDVLHDLHGAAFDHVLHEHPLQDGRAQAAVGSAFGAPDRVVHVRRVGGRVREIVGVGVGWDDQC